ncbi:unnamed protein product [Peronospora effusa]|nr:unnamed protein product [Peronospora effusa]
MPWSLPMKHILPEHKSWYLLTAAPAIPSDVLAKLEVLSSKYSEETNCRTIHFMIIGPSHMNLFIEAKKTKLTSWSLGNGDNGSVVEAEDAYIIQFCSGTVSINLSLLDRGRVTSLLMLLLLGTTLRSPPRK